MYSKKSPHIVLTKINKDNFSQFFTKINQGITRMLKVNKQGSNRDKSYRTSVLSHAGQFICSMCHSNIKNKHSLGAINESLTILYITNSSVKKHIINSKLH